MLPPPRRFAVTRRLFRHRLFVTGLILFVVVIVEITDIVAIPVGSLVAQIAKIKGCTVVALDVLVDLGGLGVGGRVLVELGAAH